ncbi:unnamed protein product, partial [Nesidiocoris tenuis]
MLPQIVTLSPRRKSWSLLEKWEQRLRQILLKQEKNPEKPKEEVNNTPTNPKESAKPSTLSSSKESTAPTQSPKSTALNPKFRKRPDCKTPQGKDGPTNPPQSLLSKDQAQQNTTGRQGSVGRSTTPSSIASSSSRSKGTPVSKRPQRKAKQNKKSKLLSFGIT